MPNHILIYAANIARIRMCIALVIVCFIAATNIEAGIYEDVDLVQSAQKGDLYGVQAALNKGARIDRLVDLFDPFHSSDHNIPATYQTALMAAASAGHTSVVSYLLDQGADVNAVEERDGDKTGVTALMIAANLETARLLVEHGADINLKDEAGENALMHHLNDTKICKYLLSRGADIEARDNQGNTVLINSAGRSCENPETDNSYTSVSFFLANGAVVDARDNSGGTALMAAASSGNLKSVKILLDQGANINLKDNQEQTALSEAATSSNAEVVRFLIANGANAQFKTAAGNSLLMLSAQRGQADIIKMLIDNKEDLNGQNVEGESALLQAIKSDRMEVVKMLLGAGADPNTKNLKQESPLYLVAEKGDLELLRLLCDKGAVFSHNDMDRALLEAVYGGKSEMLDYLLGKCAEAGTLTNINYAPEIDSALSTAVSQKDERVIHLLLEKGANMDARDHYGSSALTVAVSEGNLAIVQLFLEKGADVKALDSQHGTTLISVASGNYNSEETNRLAIASLLLKRGIAVNATNADGKTALMNAAYLRRAGLVELLLDNGADAMIKDKNGNDAFFYSKKIWTFGGGEDESGTVIEPIPEMVMRLANEMNQHGDATALGDCYLEGVGIEKDTAEALKYYRQAAKNGFAEAQVDLALQLFAKGDKAESLEWLRKAANQGNANAQNYLGNCCLNGIGMEKDPPQGLQWVTKAANQGLAVAQLNLGKIYYLGVFVDKNEIEAKKWMRKAADQGNREAAETLSYLGKQ